MKTILISSLAFLLASCSLAPHSSAEKEISGKTTFKNERVQTLSNGLKIYFIQDETLPRVGLQILVPTGSVNEPVALAGINALTAGMLDQGTKTKKALVIADLFADAGAEFEAQPGHDFTILSTSALTTQFVAVLDLFSEVLYTPAFYPEDLERTRQQMLVSLRSRRDRSGTWADYLMVENFYRGSAYGRDLNGMESTLKKISRQDVQKFYQSFYRPQGAIVAVTGRFDAEMEKKIVSTFSNWKAGAAPAKSSVNMEINPPKGMMKIETPHKAQTEIRIIQKGVKRSDPDFLKLRLANEILGGSFASRLNQRVRDDLGLTYSIFSYLDSRDIMGAWVVTTFSKNESADRTINETLDVVRKFSGEGANQKELDAAKNLSKSQFLRALETADKLAYNLMVLDFYGIGAQYLINFNRDIDSYSLSDINATARRHLKPNDMLIMSFN